MQDNQRLLKRLIEAKDYFAKENGHIIYRDTDGKLKVDYSKLSKEDNRSFVPYVKAALKNTKLLSKAEHISGSGYKVFILGPAINKYDIQSAKNRLQGRANITSNLSDYNRDMTEVIITFYQ